MMRKLILSVFCVSILISGCGKNPIEKLQSDTAYNDLTERFWANERLDKTPLWKQAKTYCSEGNNYRDKINCVPVVRQIPFDGSTEVPKYGSSGHYLTVPNF